MHFTEVIEKLKVSISNLPAEEAHRILAPVHRRSTKDYLKENPSYKTSCVAVILFPDDEATRLLLIERQDSNTAHGGQISFPGGKREMDDATLLDTAMREMYEEVGVSPSLIRHVGKLSDLYIPVSNFLVHPFVGYAESKPAFQPSITEVKTIVTPDINTFLTDDLPVERFETRSGGWIEAPYFPYERFRIWGATAMIVSELVHLIKK